MQHIAATVADAAAAATADAAASAAASGTAAAINVANAGHRAAAGMTPSLRNGVDVARCERGQGGKPVACGVAAARSAVQVTQAKCELDATRKSRRGLGGGWRYAGALVRR